MGKKRKGNHHTSYRFSEIEDRQDRKSPNSPKRRRLDEDMPTADSTLTLNEGENNDEGWTMVTSRHQKHKQSRQDKEHDNYPRLRFHQTYQSQLRIRDLRDLGMYVLADEIAPKWVAVADSKRITEVVVLMLPGMDKTTLDRARDLMQKRAPKQEDTSRNKSDETSDNINGQDSATLDTHNETSKTGSNFRTSIAAKLVASADRSANTSTSQDWLFENILSVQAPGDIKVSRVHSPLQAMLLGPERDQRNGFKTPKSQNSTAELTPITEFVHSAEELREAEFPIHPATFTNPLDADLEATRRKQTGQSVDNGWVDTNVIVSTPNPDPHSRDPISKGLNLYSIDCEMVQTTDDVYSLARVSMISYPNGRVIIDKYVKPSLPIKNYFTQFSGITPEILASVTTTLGDIQTELLGLLDSSCILLGHSLDSDLNALKLTHPFLVDTSVIYPHPRGLPMRSSLKYLTTKYLKREIQTAGADGHNSVEDAQAVLDLVKLKCEKGVKWGTMEANGEPVFKRLKDCGRTSAMVDYGTPERGFGKDATYPIGCQDDEDVTNGVIRAVKGDKFYDFEIPVTGAEYVWGRLRALEYARGWVNGPAADNAAGAGMGEGNGLASVKTEADNTTEEQNLDAIALKTLERVQRIYDALPAKTLLILFSGTGDMRPVLRLQAQQQAYKKEFKVKKWDELTVKWTDTEEQALRRACADARSGWGVCTIK